MLMLVIINLTKQYFLLMIIHIKLIQNQKLFFKQVMFLLLLFFIQNYFSFNYDHTSLFNFFLIKKLSIINLQQNLSINDVEVIILFSKSFLNLLFFFFIFMALTIIILINNHLTYYIFPFSQILSIHQKLYFI